MTPIHDLWERFHQSILAFVRKRVPTSDVDDVVQDIFIRAAGSIDGLRKEERAEAWLLGIARRAIADAYRKRAHSNHVSPGDDLLANTPDETARPAENLSKYSGEHDVHEEVLSWLRPMADEISEPYRTALIRADFDKIPQRALAKELGLSESGLKSRVQRARMKLANVLKRCCEVEFGTEGRAVAFRRLRNCECD